jgi:hypothetical protein
MAAISISGLTRQLENVTIKAPLVTKAACALAQHLDINTHDRHSPLAG